MRSRDGHPRLEPKSSFSRQSWVPGHPSLPFARRQRLLQPMLPCSSLLPGSRILPMAVFLPREASCSMPPLTLNPNRSPCTPTLPRNPEPTLSDVPVSNSGQRQLQQSSVRANTYRIQIFHRFPRLKATFLNPMTECLRPHKADIHRDFDSCRISYCV